MHQVINHLTYYVSGAPKITLFRGVLLSITLLAILKVFEYSISNGSLAKYGFTGQITGGI